MTSSRLGSGVASAGIGAGTVGMAGIWDATAAAAAAAYRIGGRVLAGGVAAAGAVAAGVGVGMMVDVEAVVVASKLGFFSLGVFWADLSNVDFRNGSFRPATGLGGSSEIADPDAAAGGG